MPVLTARRRSPWWRHSRLWAALYALMLPTLVGMLVFVYWPNWQTIRYAFFRWDGALTEEWRGGENFTEAFADNRFLWTFQLVGILLIANLIKMWPSILVAVVIHRLRSARWQYLYRVLFVIPMVIPALVWLLLWKQFFDPSAGVLNGLLNATGLMGVLHGLDSPDHGMPAVAGFLNTTGFGWDPARPLASWLCLPLKAVHHVFGGPWGLGLFGFALALAAGGWQAARRTWPLWLALLATGWLVWGPWRLLPLAGLALALGEWRWRRLDLAGLGALRWWAVILAAVALVLVLLSAVWTEPVKAFAYGTPSWLGHSKLVIPTIIFWGFPWVGTVGVLIYLAGLQNISKDIYEAAELDGVGPVRRLIDIELPMIMAQVRINLIFMTIGTLTDYGLVLVLLGPDGGPANRGLVPGLYMYSKAFVQNEFGYACALGLIMAAAVLLLTMVYQRYVKVDK